MEILLEVDVLAPAKLSRSAVVGRGRERFAAALKTRIVEGDREGPPPRLLAPAALARFARKFESTRST